MLPCSLFFMTQFETEALAQLESIHSALINGHAHNVAFCVMLIFILFLLRDA